MTMKASVRFVSEAAGIAVIAVLMVVIGVRYLSPAPTTQPAAVGVRLEASVGIDFAAGSRTVILFLQASCPFCRESAPFYRRLLTRRTTDVRVVVAAPAVDAGLRAYLVLQAIEPDAVVYVERDELPVSATPTLLVVGPDGVVTNSWIGLLDAEQEADVLNAVFG